MKPDKRVKRAAEIIWCNGESRNRYRKHWNEIWEYETDPERVAKLGEWWIVQAARKVLALRTFDEGEK